MGVSEKPKYDFQGIKRIEIPKIDADFMPDNNYGIDVIKKYLPQILVTHQRNAEKEKQLYEFYLGEQDIHQKQRLYQKDCENNNRIVENHAFRQVNFKVGMITSEKRDYTYKVGSQGDDLKYLDYYHTDVDFFSKDKEVKEWIYAVGVGVSFVAPRTDIIESVGIDNVTGEQLFGYSKSYDVNTEAPFTFSAIDPRENFVVYSSARDKEPLFCVSIVEIDVGDKDTIDTRKELYIETRYANLKTTSDIGYGDIQDIRRVSEKFLHYIPMVEHAVNRSRMGIVELNYDLFNSVNTLISSVADMVVDNANVILVFKNTDISREDVLAMKQAGAIIINDANNGANADLDTIKIEINYEGLNTYYEQRISKMYDIAGVPLASGQVTSGGDTGQARLFGSGWNNSYTMSNNDITTLLKSDYLVLKQMLMICKQVPNNPVNELSASQIDIKYRINQNDNFLVKAQGIAQLAGVNFPKEEIIKASGLFSDTNTVAMKWEAEVEKALARGQSLAINGNIGKTNSPNTENATIDESNNNSQE